MRCLAVLVTAFFMWLIARKGEASMGSQAGIENLRFLVGAVEMKRTETGE